MDFPHADRNTSSPSPNGRGNPAPAPPADDLPPPPVQLQIKFADNRGNEQAFKLKSTTNITKAMASTTRHIHVCTTLANSLHFQDAFSAKIERPRASLRFLFEGVRLIGGTVAENDLQDGDLIEVHEEQLGGGDGCCGGKCHCGDKNCDGKCCGGKGGCGGGKGK